jgi:ADP-ribose pyrophosphatase YjhB (NUDIX family)
MTEVKTIAGFAPDNVEAGVGLALQDDEGRYLFVLAGTRHRCPPGELFYAGIGGHREAGESWLACAQREAKEEISTAVEILSAPLTWFVSHNGSVERIEVIDRPRPLAFYEMIHPPNTARAGEAYRIVVYKARLCGWPKDLPREETQGVIALTAGQVIQGLERRPTLAELVEGGGSVVAGAETVIRGVRLYPLGTAVALAHILRHVMEQAEIPGRLSQAAV